MLLNLVTKIDSIWIVSCSWSNHTTLLLMFVAEKVLLLLVISLTVYVRLNKRINNASNIGMHYRWYQWMSWLMFTFIPYYSRCNIHSHVFVRSFIWKLWKLKQYSILQREGIKHWYGSEWLYRCLNSISHIFIPISVHNYSKYYRMWSMPFLLTSFEYWHNIAHHPAHRLAI